MRAWAVIKQLPSGEISIIERFRTYYDALEYAALLNRNSQAVTVRFVAE